MSIIDNANSLGKMLSQIPEFKNYKEAEINFLNDEKLQKEVFSYKEMYSTYLKSLDKELEKEIDLKYDILMGNSNFKNYMESKNKFEKIYNTVHSLIDYYVGMDKKRMCDKSNNNCGNCGK